MITCFLVGIVKLFRSAVFKKMSSAYDLSNIIWEPQSTLTSNFFIIGGAFIVDRPHVFSTTPLLISRRRDFEISKSCFYKLGNETSYKLMHILCVAKFVPT